MVEVKEKEIAKKYKLICAKEKASFKEELQTEFDAKHAALTSRLDAKIAENAQ